MALTTTELSEGGFRRALSTFASSVTIITCRWADGMPIGMTATAFTSVSSASLLVLACINRSHRSLRAITERGCFGVNILGSDSREQSDYCARPGQAKVLAPWWLDESGWQAPAFRDALSFLDCTVVQTMEAGTHAVLLGRVTKIGVHDHLDTRSPLIHFRGTYRHLDTVREPREPVPLPIVFEDIS